MIENHTVVSKDEWLAARKQLLIKEKEYSRLVCFVSRANYLDWS